MARTIMAILWFLCVRTSWSARIRREEGMGMQRDERQEIKEVKVEETKVLENEERTGAMEFEEFKDNKTMALKGDCVKSPGDCRKDDDCCSKICHYYGWCDTNQYGPVLQKEQRLLWRRLRVAQQRSEALWSQQRMVDEVLRTVICTPKSLWPLGVQ